MGQEIDSPKKGEHILLPKNKIAAPLVDQNRGYGFFCENMSRVAQFPNNLDI